MRAIVGRVHDEGVVGDTKIIQRLEDRADVLVVVDHGVVVRALPTPRLTDALRLRVGAEVHVSEFTQTKNGLLVFLPLDEIHGSIGDVVVDRHHPRLGERAGVLTDLLADFAEARIDRRIVLVRGFAVHHAARSVPRKECRVFRVVRQFRFFLGVQVVEVAVELVEAVHSGKELVAVAKMVLAELSGCIAERLEQLGNRRVFLLQPERGAGKPTLVIPVRKPDCPVMNDARPAVQLCSA